MPKLRLGGWGGVSPVGSSEEGLQLAKRSACAKAQRPAQERCDWQLKEVQAGWSAVSE